MENRETRQAAWERIVQIACTVEAFLTRWGPVLLVVFAVIYYGQYYRTGLNLGGEGGTNAVLAMRLMEGQRPIVDTFLGYNLLWFYPLVALFQLTGPDYVAMRVFFFALCTINALLGFTIVRACTRQAWLATGVGVLLVLIPGMIFRNYMGFIGTLSMLVFLKAYVLPEKSNRRRLVWMSVAGAGLALCFLIRIEPSLLLTVVWLGLAVLYPLGSKTHFRERLRQTVLGTFAGAVVLVGIHGLFAWHASSKGFGKEFLDQYHQFAGLLVHELESEWQRLRPIPPVVVAEQQPVTAASVVPVETPTVTPAPVDAAPTGRDGRLQRPPLTKIWEARSVSNRYLGLVIYYPVFWCVVFVGVAALLLLISIIRGDDFRKQQSLVVLTSTGCALTLFPQYFFFRPDPPHVSEFMVAFLPAVAVSAFALWQAAEVSRVFRIPVLGLTVFSLALVPIYLKAIMPRDSAGTISKHGRLAEFEALNGVRVKMPADEVADMIGLRDAILNNSKPGDYVICYPYSPTINFMTDRPSYEYNLYVDNATAGTDFQRDAIERMTSFRPAVVVIDNRAVNQTEESRFNNWATDVMAYLRENYTLYGTYRQGNRENTVFVRKLQ